LVQSPVRRKPTQRPHDVASPAQPANIANLPAIRCFPGEPIDRQLDDHEENRGAPNRIIVRLESTYVNHV
jgi:hypothetical protein